MRNKAGIFGVTETGVSPQKVLLGFVGVSVWNMKLEKANLAKPTATRKYASVEAGSHWLASATTAKRRRVYDIVSFLPLGDLEVLKDHWVKGGMSGVTKELFLENMLRVRTFGLCCCGLQVWNTDTCFGLETSACHTFICMLPIRRLNLFGSRSSCRFPEKTVAIRMLMLARVSVLPLLEEHNLVPLRIGDASLSLVLINMSTIDRDSDGEADILAVVGCMYVPRQHSPPK